MRRQERLGRSKPFEEELERRRTARLPAKKVHVVGAEPVAGDLIDDDRVEVVHHRVAVAVERIGGDRRQCRCNLGERCLHRRVERRAPERVPGAVAVIEIRMNEPFGDGSMCELDDREHGPCAAARLEAGRRVGRERYEVAHTNAPRVDAAGQREVSGRRRADG